MKAFSSLFLCYEKKRQSSVKYVMAILYKNGANKIAINAIAVRIAAFVLLLKGNPFPLTINLPGL
jgi:hypothetical protein